MLASLFKEKKHFFLYFIVFIRKLYKRQAKIYHNSSFTIFTQKRIQDEKKENEKRKRREKKRKKKEKKWEGEV